MFKVGDKVYDVRHGWGKVEDVEYSTLFPILVDFEEYFDMYTVDGKDAILDKKACLFFEQIEIPDSALTRAKFRASYGEKYYSVNHYGVVERSIERSYKIDSRLVDIGNYFKTEKEAKESKFYKIFHDKEVN
ncbi:MAG: hypothetical protein ACRC5T_10620 [Cetobacterium sp.]